VEPNFHRINSIFGSIDELIVTHSLTHSLEVVHSSNGAQVGIIYFKSLPSTHVMPQMIELYQFLDTRGGVSHCGLAIYVKKYLKAEEEDEEEEELNWKFQEFHHAKI
jgi:hypothetical protein